MIYTKRFHEMRKRYIIIGYLFSILAYGAAHASSSCPTSKEFETLSAPSVADRFWIASRIYQMVTTRFAHMEALGPSYDFNKEYRHYLSSIAEVTTRLDFDKETSKLFASLHNGHTIFSDYWANCGSHLPFEVNVIQGKWVVTVSHISSMPLGSELIALNHDEFSRWADRNIEFIAGSSLRSQRQELSYEGWLWPQHFTVTIQKPSKNIATITIDRNIPISSNIKGHYKPSIGVGFTEITPAVTRIAVSGFDQPENELKMVEAVKKHVNSPALLFDLRQTKGGIMPLKLVLSLLEHPTKDMVAFTPQHIAVNDAYNDMGMAEVAFFPNTWMRYGGEILNPESPIYHGKVFVLTDGGCASACEGFVMTMKSSQRAVILGEPTFGINGNRSEVGFPEEEMWFGVGTEDARWPDGSKFEGIGVIPDISISLTQEELVSGKDAVLEKAVKYINTVMKEDHHG